MQASGRVDPRGQGDEAGSVGADLASDDADGVLAGKAHGFSQAHPEDLLDDLHAHRAEPFRHLPGVGLGQGGHALLMQFADQAAQGFAHQSQDILVDAVTMVPWTQDVLVLTDAGGGDLGFGGKSLHLGAQSDLPGQLGSQVDLLGLLQVQAEGGRVAQVPVPGLPVGQAAAGLLQVVGPHLRRSPLRPDLEGLGNVRHGSSS